MNNVSTSSKEKRDEYAAIWAERRRLMQERAADYTMPSGCDLSLWQELAAKYGVKLPAWYYPAESKYMWRYMHRLHITREDTKEMFGDGWKLSDFARLNPDKGLLWFVGNLLEMKNA
jgi:hypothetical protein